MAKKEAVVVSPEVVAEKQIRVVRALYDCSFDSFNSITGVYATRGEMVAELPSEKVTQVSYILLDCRSIRLTFKVGFENENPDFIQEFTNWTCGLFGRTVYPELVVWQGLPYTRTAVEDHAFNHKHSEISAKRFYWTIARPQGGSVVCACESFVVDDVAIAKIRDKDYTLPKFAEVEFL